MPAKCQPDEALDLVLTDCGAVGYAAIGRNDERRRAGANAVFVDNAAVRIDQHMIQTVIVRDLRGRLGIGVHNESDL